MSWANSAAGGVTRSGAVPLSGAAAGGSSWVQRDGVLARAAPPVAPHPSQAEDNPNNDIVVPPGSSPADAVSDMSWAPAAAAAGSGGDREALLAVASWDCLARVYGVNAEGGVRPAVALLHNGPVLAARFAPGGARLATACADGAVRVWDLETDSFTVIGQHAGPARFCVFAGRGLLASAGVDGAVDLWDARTPARVSQTLLGGRPFAMDAGDDRIALALSDRPVFSIGLGGSAPGSPAKPSVPTRSKIKLRMPLRSVAVLPGTGRCVAGSIEGRCSVTRIDCGPQPGGKGDYAFKCHRGPGVAGQHTMHAVNAIASVPGDRGSFFTGGSDGCFVSWNSERKERLAQFKPLSAPITSLAVSEVLLGVGARLLAVATGDDWSRGVHAHNGAKVPARVYVHRVGDADLDRSKVSRPSA